MAERIPRANELANPVDDNSDANESGTEWWDEEEKDSSDQLKAANSIRNTQWPRAPGTAASEKPPKPPPKPTARTSSKKSEKRYSVQKPLRLRSKGRQRKQNAQAGIKLVTNFSNHRAAKLASPPGTQDRSKPGCFVDLAALQALNGGPPQSSGGFWKSRKAKDVAAVPNSGPSATQPAPDAPIPSAPAKPKGLVPSPLNLNDDLSPSDRPIVIGISIPSASLEKHAISPQTASSYTSKISNVFGHQTAPVLSPETPTIVITPADDSRAWSPLDDSKIARASSVYSQPQHDAFGIYQSKNAPPVPQMPAGLIESENQRIAAQKSYFSPDSDQGTMWGDEDTKFSSPSRPRITSSCTVFEEDESPILARTARARSISVSTKGDKHASVSTAATRQSMGWWNVIVTPFMTRSNTVAAKGVFEDQQRPAVPSLAIASAKAAEAERDRKQWEKQFSPVSPLSSTTINSDAWWEPSDKDNIATDAQRSGLSPVDQKTRHAAQPSSGTLPFVLSQPPQVHAEQDLVERSPTRTFEPSQPNFSLPRAPSAAAVGRRGEPGSGTSALPSASNRGVSQNLNPFVQPRLEDLDGAPTRPQPTVARGVPVAPAVQNSHDPTPPPPYSPAPRRYRAILPPGSTRGVGNAQDSAYPASPGPVSPGLAAAMSSGGSIPMSNVPVSSVPRTPINLNSGYPELPPRGQPQQFFPPPPTSGRKAESKRRRYEKEEAVARKAGGLWRGRGCMPDRGCYGRRGAEGRKRRRWYLCLIIGFIALLTVIVVLATTLHRKSKTAAGPSQWLNLTGFPPIYTGLSTVAAPTNNKANTGCVVPATQWSCDLPPELQASVAPNPPNSPNFLLNIQWDNSSAANATFANVTGNPNLATRSRVGNPVSAGHYIRYLLLKARQAVTFTPNPAPPSFADESFLGSTTDGIVSSDKAGEPTPFYISFESTTSSSPTKRSLLSKRQPVISSRADNSSDPFPDLGTIIPAPSLNSDGTAAPANLLPLPSQQPIRLYDRGLPTEHYGFYTYFNRSIFLKSITGPNKTNPTDPDDENGGVKESEAAFRCTWSQTRFLVQMWTKANTTTSLLNSTTSASSFAPGQDFQQPGSFPYPITITLDRHGGDPKLKMLYCYELNDQGGLVATSGKINEENRGFGGTLINPAPTVFANSSDPGLGGFDGGTGGCGCQWTNFQNVAP